MLESPTTLALLALLVALPACEDDGGGAAPVGDGGALEDSGGADTDGPGDVGLVADDDVAPDAALADAHVYEAPDAAQAGSFKVRAGVEYISVWRAEPGTSFEVLSPAGEVVAAAESDELGSIKFRELTPGAGYAVRAAGTEEQVEGLEVLSWEGSLPDPSFYEQRLQPGFGYLTTRDGTRLSVFVSLPGPPEDGPYPTVVNYSGYSPSQPGQPLGGPADFLCDAFPVLCDAPSFPTGIIAGVMGYATVGVNVRGTGCSGDAYDYFDKPQILDGYDVIEVVSRQPWVKHGKVGMVGLSYPGITQLFVARTRPPGLAAIAPMSVIADTASSTLAPGGIYNNGFALSWIENVLEKASPYGHRWIQDVVDGGDALCEEHQLLHGQKLDAVTKALENPYYTEEVTAPVDPSRFVGEIDVPVFLVGQWQDEQTGPHFPALADKFDAAPVFLMTATNGVHADGFAPQVLAEWANFLSLYVRREAPFVDETVRAVVPTFMDQVYGDALRLPEGRFEGMSYEDAKAAFEAEPPIRIIFESGAPEDVEPGAPQGAFEARFDAWPLPETVATRWYLQPDGALAPEPPDADGGASAFVHDAEAGARGTLGSGGVNGLQPDWAWRPPAEGDAVTFATEPLADDLVMVGHGSVDLWLRSTADDADLEVTLTEVRADGSEQYIQAGWLRASHRALREDATALRPVKSHTEPSIEPLVPGEWTEVRVELMPFAHAFRAGSRLRLVVDTPGDSMASWRFLLTEYDTPPTHDIGHDAEHPSSIALSVIPGVEVPAEQAECTRLRGQPCRPYTPLPNLPAED